MWRRTSAWYAEHKLRELLRRTDRIMTLYRVANLEERYALAKKTEDRRVNEPHTWLIIIEFARVGEDLGNQGFLAQSSFSQRPSEWELYEAEAKERRHPLREVKCMEEEDKQAKHRRQEENNMIIEVR